jgi:glucosyl-dolichyl phosphate glucuronosyltransferase
MNNTAKVSVVICTYNRCQTLRATVESVAAQALPVPWEILVVDNNSMDDTRTIVETLQRHFPDRIRYHFEPQQGLSFARNSGVREALGEILVFIDDDETAGPDWLRNLTSSLHDGEWAGAGGRVVPSSSFTLPAWLSINSSFASGPLSMFDLGMKPGPLEEPAFGANMAFRKEVFDRCGGFRTDLGRAGTNMISNEDTEFGRRLLAAGLSLRYEPQAVTFHPVEENRLQKGYFLVWWFNKGRSDIREAGVQSDLQLFGVPVRKIASLLWSSIRWVFQIDPTKRFGRKLDVWNCAGLIVESYQQWVGAKTRPEVAVSVKQKMCSIQRSAVEKIADPRPSLNISLIICTFNRGERLAKTLANIAVQTFSSPTTWEVLVVDNNSTDQTRSVVEDYYRRLPAIFRYLFESQPGKSHALNKGIKEARGNILAFTDDDVMVESTWLQNLTLNLKTGEWSGSGGRVLPAKDFSQPPWLSSMGGYAQGPLALFDPPANGFNLANAPFGNNMAYRREMFEKYGVFRTDLGPRPSSQIRGEDTEFGDRLMAAGEKIRYEPTAVAYHDVGENRAQQQYFLNWWFDKARAEIRQYGVDSGAFCCSGVPLFLVRRLVVWTFRWMVTLTPAERFTCKIKVWRTTGEILECHRLRKIRLKPVGL